MTIHAVRLKTSTKQKSDPSNPPSPEPPDLVDVLPDCVSQNVFGTLTEKLSEQSIAPQKTNTKTDGSGTEYIQAVYRASENDTKSEVLDEFEQGAVKDAKWYKLEHHVCHHDITLNSDIIEVDAVNDSITVEGDVRYKIDNLNEIRVTGSGSLDGTYSVTSFNLDNGDTVIQLGSDISGTERLGKVVKTGCDDWSKEREGGTPPSDV